jgi:hypothetical protein
MGISSATRLYLTAKPRATQIKRLARALVRDDGYLFLFSGILLTLVPELSGEKVSTFS